MDEWEEIEVRNTGFGNLKNTNPVSRTALRRKAEILEETAFKLLSAADAFEALNLELEEETWIESYVVQERNRLINICGAVKEHVNLRANEESTVFGDDQMSLQAFRLEEKYYYVVSALGSEAAANIEGLLDNPPATIQYEAIKNALLKIYEISDWQKKRLLIGLEGLGDRRPTELLRYMQGLHKAEKDDPLFMAFFMHQLPQATRAILAAQEFDDVFKLAQAEHSNMATSGINKVWTSPNTKSSSHESTEKKGKQPELCRFHRKFGENSRNCLLPCTWAGKSPASHY
ncbi:hypothetical protein TCAL_16911 [Tigriopus californicus]|uniref:Uncharacterized protein n=1 Tax=Tigriopus californicus TaxID=6832 RepID=A0A553P6U6_TIGCA|nr:hypothetical protein TCAL_16911 [Tigriopus californicus]